jgi:hypothetical protein
MLMLFVGASMTCLEQGLFLLIIFYDTMAILSYLKYKLYSSKALSHKQESCVSILDGVTRYFSMNLILPARYGPGAGE